MYRTLTTALASLALLLVLAPASVAQSLAADCPNTARITGSCDSYVASPASGPSFVAGEAGLVGETVLYAPSEEDDSAYRAAIAAALGGATVDYLDAGAVTPTLAQLQAYDVVYTWANESYADPTGFGDALADYVDGGGRVIMGAFTTYDLGNSLGGRIRTVGYSPVANPTGDNFFVSEMWAGDGTQFFSGVAAAACEFRDIVDLQGAGIEDGTYTNDGETLAAYRPDFGVMFLNGEGSASLGCTGDWATIAANMIAASGVPATPDVVFISDTRDPVTRGSFYRTRFTVTNHTAAPILGGVFIDIQVPGGTTITHRLENKVFQPGETKEYRTKEGVRLNAPGGFYAVSVSFESVDRTTVYDAETGDFTVPAMTLAQSAQTSGDASLTLATPEAGPNPFSQSTTIRYTLAETSQVDLRVYDATGREVALLTSGTQSAGAQSATFDGGRLPAGVYVWRLAIDGAVTSGRVSLVR